MLKLMARKSPWSDSVDLLAWHDSPTGVSSIGLPLSMRQVEQGEYVEHPTVRLNTSEAQKLMDELWDCGLRPSEGSGSAGALAATQRHLEDMRTIALSAVEKFGVISKQKKG